MAKNDCPCTSGLALKACCGPYLKGVSEPPDAEALMRSRFSAFATGNAAHLWRTLDPEHPDRARPEAEVLRELRAAAARYRYMRLAILDRELTAPGSTSVVLFRAGVYERGREVSFLERSTFRHDGTGWRYFQGISRSSEPGWERLTLATFT